MNEHFLHLPKLDPVFFSFGPIAIHWYGVMYFLSFLAMFYLATITANKSAGQWTYEQVIELLFYSFLGGILGGRIGYVLFYQFEYFTVEPIFVFKIWQGGMSFHGGLIGVVGALYLFSRKFKKDFLNAGDFIAFLAPIGLGLGHLGHFINAELWGVQTNVPWAIIFPTDPLQIPRHPSQLYAFFLEGALLFLILYLIRGRIKIQGITSGVFFIVYGILNMALETMRESEPYFDRFLLFSSMVQLMSVTMILIGVYIINFSYIEHQKRLIIGKNA